MDAIAVDLDKTTAGPFLAIRVVVVMQRKANLSVIIYITEGTLKPM